jgi:competence ComEA-like helix-hairpin-helix protein
MPTPSERKALLYFALVALLGAGMQLREGAKVPRRTPAEERELRNQLLAADRAARAKERKVTAKGRGSRTKAKADPAAEVQPVGGAPYAAPAPPVRPAFPIDVDRASVADLQRLPGIGPALAGRIVANRDSFGAFGSIQALDEVRGIGPAMIARIGPLVTFSGPSRTPRAPPNRPRKAARGGR